MKLTYTDDEKWSAAVAFDRYDGDRVRYRYELSDSDGVVGSGDDLTAPGEINLPNALVTLLVFAAAAAEALDHGSTEGANMFPASAHGLLVIIGSGGFAFAASYLQGDDQ